MTHRLTIQYAQPADPAAFDKHYFERHLPLCDPLPGLRSASWSKPRPLGGAASVYLVTHLDFGDEATMRAALRSPEMQRVAEDADTLQAERVMFTGEVVTLRE